MGATGVGAIGVRTHTGWAAVVALAGAPDRPEVALKRRVQLETRFEAGAVYHASQGLPLAEAERLVRAAADRYEAAARAAMAAIAGELRAAGVAPVAAAVVGAGRALPPLASILRSHPLVHAAEGELYRHVFERACQGCGLAAARVPGEELAPRLARALARPEASVLADLTAMGKASGRPWGEDQKLAALAAWCALCEGAGATGG